MDALPHSFDGKVIPVKGNTPHAAFRKACKRADIKDLHWHDLRHTAITRLAQKLPNVIELAAVSGHRSLAMLKRYYHPSATELARKLG
ncbi:tyrosine-type recombinase/integrase [Burkholderia pseudomallei]|uniref:tyrosine-type recombinase/integrase n=1 Tax=Burkholderia pseudomallei TaxID=28450 RepID=UPI00070FE168|nr:tyrosine-type recombinase/integrase [Burkholderia pseudomallei]